MTAPSFSTSNHPVSSHNILADCSKKHSLVLVNFSQKSENQNSNKIKQKNKNKSKPILLPEENYLNFKESGKIPDFLNTK